jgi:acetyl-CoA carboxylase biotin carboxylase subunit
MLQALHEYKVVGVRTTIPVLARIVAHDDFRAGHLSTHFLDRVMPELTATEGRHATIALITAVLAEYERLGRQTLSPVTSPGLSAWKRAVLGRWRALP